MAIGDAFLEVLGVSPESREPASGVEEMVNSCASSGTTDGLTLFEASDGVAIMTAPTLGTNDTGQWTNTAFMILNGHKISGGGSADKVVITGVQTNV